MRIAITGGTGFVGGHLARRLADQGHEVVLISRRRDQRSEALERLPGVRHFPVGLHDEAELAEAFSGCDAVAHCAGINRAVGRQTFPRVHVEGTRNVIRAAERAGARKIALLSFLRARPNCRSGYHESKWEAEELVRSSGLDFTILKAGVIYGRGDHMLDHLSHAFHTFPVFGFVGLKDRRLRPMAVADVVRVLEAALVDGRLSRETVALMGPEELTLNQAVRRVARVVGRKPIFIRLPVWLHYLLARVWEGTMVTPMVSRAQVRILSEGLVECLPAAKSLPDNLVPRTRFTEEEIRRGLPAPGSFGKQDCRCLSMPVGSA